MATLIESNIFCAVIHAKYKKKECDKDKTAVCILKSVWSNTTACIERKHNALHKRSQNINVYSYALQDKKQHNILIG